MQYRDFMQKFRPLYSPDDGSGAAAPEPAAPVQEAAPAAPEAAAAPEIKSEPTLLEAAEGKPKPDAAAAAVDPGKKEEPAPADAAKPDAKDAKPEGDKPKEDAAKDKKDEPAKIDPDKKDATAEAQPPAPIAYEPFKLPEGIKLDDKELAKFSEFAGKAQIPQDVAQGLVDLYVAERQNDATQLRAEQRKVWDTLNDTWKTESRNDPDIGGSDEALLKNLSMGKAVIEEYLKPEEAKEYLAHLRNNGMGNYKLHVKLLRNIGKALNVFEDGIVPANPQAPKGSKSPGNRGWYDKSLNSPA